MKKLKNIYNKIISVENLYQAAYMAARGRRYRDTTADFNFHLEEEIQRLRKELEMKTYKHGQYRVFTIFEPKERRISAAPFRDRVVHHAAHDVIEPMIDKTFIHDSYACRKGKGTHKAVDRAQSFLRANKFCFHGDIKKYFPSIDHEILKGMLRRRIEDENLIWLLDEILNSVASEEWRVAREKNSGEWRVESERGEDGGESTQLQGFGDMAEEHGVGENDLQKNRNFSETGNVWADKPDAQSGGFCAVKYSRRAGEKAHQGVYSIPSSGVGVVSGTGNSDDIGKRTRLSQREQRDRFAYRRDSEDDLRNASFTRHSVLMTRHSPLATRHSKGLPIGNLTSQFFANLYLNELDYFVKFELKCRYYLRYMDDFLVFDNDKKLLLEIKDKIKEFLKNRLNIDLHQGKSQIYKTGAGIKFLGFRLFKNHRRLTSDNVRRFRKRLKGISGEWLVAREGVSLRGRIAPEAILTGLLRRFTPRNDTRDFIRHSVDSVRCWTAHSKYANTGNLRFHLRRGLIEKNPALTDMAGVLCEDKAFEFFREREREFGAEKIGLFMSFIVSARVNGFIR